MYVSLGYLDTNLDILHRMKHSIFTAKSTFLIALLLITSAIGVYFFTTNSSDLDWITTTVERGDVQDIVSVSGFVEAKNTAQLSFPVTGIVTDIFTEEGVEVKKGEL